MPPIAETETLTYAPTNFIAGDSPDIAIENGTLVAGQNLPARSVVGRIAASGKLAVCNPGANDGSQVAVGILVHACDATAADKNVQFYKGGNFFTDALNWHAGFDTAAKKAAAFDRTGIVTR